MHAVLAVKRGRVHRGHVGELRVEAVCRDGVPGRWEGTGVHRWGHAVERRLEERRRDLRAGRHCGLRRACALLGRDRGLLAICEIGMLLGRGLRRLGLLKAAQVAAELSTEVQAAIRGGLTG